jgi:hypothetical protein
MLAGSDGHQTPFCVLRGARATMLADDRGAQLLQAANSQLLTHHGTRARFATLVLSSRTLLSPTARLCAAEPHQRSIRALLEDRLATRGLRMPTPLVALAQAWREQIDQHAALQVARAAGARDDELARALAATFAMPSHLFEFRAQLAALWGSYAALSAAVGVRDASSAHHIVSLGTRFFATHNNNSHLFISQPNRYRCATANGFSRASTAQQRRAGTAAGGAVPIDASNCLSVWRGGDRRPAGVVGRRYRRGIVYRFGCCWCWCCC